MSSNRPLDYSHKPCSASDTCEVVREFVGIGQPCHGAYGLLDEDIANYGVGWRSLDGNVSQPEYTYRTSAELDSYPFWGSHAVYSGGGYVIELRGTVRDMIAEVRRLEADGWIDQLTRAVFIELTVYNAQVIAPSPSSSSSSSYSSSSSFSITVGASILVIYNVTMELLRAVCIRTIGGH